MGFGILGFVMEDKEYLRYDFQPTEYNMVIIKSFYNMLQTIISEIIKRDDMPEEAKKELFRYTMTNFDDLNKKEQSYLAISAYHGLQCGMAVWNTLMTINLEEKEN